MSPSCSTANAVMPTVTRSPSALRPLVVLRVLRGPRRMFMRLISRCSMRSGALVERRLHDDGFDVLAAAVDEEPRADSRHGRGHIAEADVLANRGAGAAARADADLVVRRRRAADSRGARCRGRSPRSPTSLRGSGAAFDRLERRAADEVALVELHHPAEAGFDAGWSSRRCRCRRARGAPRGGACRARRGPRA